MQKEGFEKKHSNDKKQSAKGKKAQLTFDLEEKVVFQLISSGNALTQGKENQKQLRQLISQKVKTVPYNKINQLNPMIRSALERFVDSELRIKNTQTDALQTHSARLKQIMDLYKTLSALLKQGAVPSPVQEAFYHQFAQVWSNLIDQAPQKEQNSLRENLMEVWLDIPYQILSTHLKKFAIAHIFYQISEEKQLLIEYRLLKELSNLLVDNKIQQVCTYYEIYIQKFQGEVHKQLKTSPLLEQFESETLTPKITKSDHIFSTHVLSLLRFHCKLKESILNGEEISPAVGVRVIDLLKQSSKDYERINTYILKQHYKSIIYDHKRWYMIEDKLSFNQHFITWFAEDLTQAFHLHKQLLEKEESQNAEQNDKLKFIAEDLLLREKEIGSIEALRLSLIMRNSTDEAEVIEYQKELKEKELEYVPNPLYQFDSFQCAEGIIQQLQNQQGDPSLKCEDYLTFSNYNVDFSDVVWIDDTDEKFEKMTEDLLSCDMLGFDTEFRCVSTKYEQQGVSLIQFSTFKSHYLIDFLKLQNCQKLVDFLVEVFCNPNVKKIGHTISSDIRYLTLTLHIPQNRRIQSFVDVTDTFRNLHPGQKFSSLAFLCEMYLGKKLSKYEQRSNWNRRPLKKTQIHYAALDAFSCLLIYEQMLQQKEGSSTKKVASKDYKKDKKHQQLSEYIENRKQAQKAQQKETSQHILKGKFVGDVFRSENLVYHKKYHNLVYPQQKQGWEGHRFLVDNMIKKLSSVMRNCGIDTEYTPLRDYNFAVELAEKQGRIILTRDNKFFQRKDNRVPIYLISERNDSDKMFEQIVEFFGIDLSRFSTLSRCVKCNGNQLLIISAQEANETLNFKHELKEQQFWRCQKCTQIYWEGGQFEKAKAKYEKLKK